VLVDSSGSVRDNQQPGTPDNWNLTLSFVKDVIQQGTRIGRHYDRVAVIEFSSLATLSFDFNKYYRLDDVLSAVERLPYLGSLTNTSLALNLGRQVFLDPTYGSRQNATHIMLLVTDLFEQPDATWTSLFWGNITLLDTTTDVQRFRMFFLKLFYSCT